MSLLLLLNFLLSRHVGAFSPDPSGTVRSLGRRHSPGLLLHVSFSDFALKEEPVVGLDETQSDVVFSELCEEADVSPSGMIRLKSKNGIRGVYLNQPVLEGDTIMSVPLSVCLRDDEPPGWFDCDLIAPPQASDDEAMEQPCMMAGYYNPSDWATRLAAGLLDAQLEAADQTTEKWLSILPNPSFLRASLPIHWSLEILRSACCTALELAVDSAFFARAEAIQDLLQHLEQHPKAGRFDESTRRRLCENALDIVQTRSCRVSLKTDSNQQDEQWAPPLRLLAPVFDFINHPNSGPANAEFGLDEGNERLVVRALRDLPTNAQVFIDYGESARPGWKCLASYGFVPAFDPKYPEDHMAEVYLDGMRYEVGATTIPAELVDALSSGAVDDNSDRTTTLTSEMAIRLACRLSDVAYQMLLDPLERYSEEVPETAEDIMSTQLAARLRWNQHRILLACSIGLREWALGKE